jgi:hypothetical protein
VLTSLSSHAQFRAIHKTSSTQISLLHLISIFGIHPELRASVRRRAFVSIMGRVGASVYADQAVEMQNADQKERNLGLSLLSSILFTRLLQPLNWVHRRWRAWAGASGPGEDGYRVSMVNDIHVLVDTFVRLIGTDLTIPSTTNHFWHTGTPHQSGPNSNLRDTRPWEWMWRVADGTSAGVRTTRRETWIHYFRRHVADHMFYQ